MDGILNIDKPVGITSFGVVSLVRRFSREKRVGHAGTLDPAASGVLPVCLGQGTRVIEFLVDAAKTYRAEIELGIVTDTYDREGKVVRLGDPSRVNQDVLEIELASFRGEIEQTPPPYSALKYQGKPLYQLARAGIIIEPKSRPVIIHKLTLVDWQAPVATLEVVCSKGTYIRSLAYDLGEVLGCGAYLKSLVRSQYGLFDINKSISLASLEDAFRRRDWLKYVYPIDCVLSDLKTVLVNSDGVKNIRNGRPVPVESLVTPENSPSHSLYRAYTEEGDFLAVLRFEEDSGYWLPEKVFLQHKPVSEAE